MDGGRAGKMSGPTTSATPLWTAADAATATAGTTTGAWTATGVAIDTREMTPGDLFVALRGTRDGHAFVADALAKGAAAAMVAHRPEGVAQDAPLLVVEDTLQGLNDLAASARARTAAKVTAITGSVGKTSTKDMAALMLAAQGRTHAAARSFNNHWGVPLTLARMPADTEYAVLEIGMNAPDEIRPLTKLAKPDVAIVTAIAPVHLEGLGSIEAIADAKAEIFEGLGPDGIAVVNADAPQLDRLLAAVETAGARLLTFGTKGAHRLQEVRLAAGATVVSADLDGTPVFFRIGAAGHHYAMNALAALTAVTALGADPARAMLRLSGWQPAEGRGQSETVLLGPEGSEGAITLLDESFNANPASVRAALAVLAATPVTDDIGRVAKGRRIACLGDMLELGVEAAALHAALAEAPEMVGVDLVHTCGPRMRALHAAFAPPRRGQWFEDSAAMAARAPRLVDAGDVVMVKGSKGSKMGPVLDAIRRLGTPPEKD